MRHIVNADTLYIDGNLVFIPQLVQMCEVSALAFESSEGLRYIVNADTLYIDGNLVFIPQLV